MNLLLCSCICLVYLAIVFILVDAKHIREGESDHPTDAAADATDAAAKATDAAADATEADYTETTTTMKITTEAPKEDFDKFPWEVLCKFQLNAYPCYDYSSKNTFYYDILMDDCKKGQVTASCPHSNINTFQNFPDCTSSCRESGNHEIVTNLTKHPEVYCRLQPDFGYCNDYYPKYYFDLTTRQCRGFSWSGCGGNKNRFDTDSECMTACLPKVHYETLETDKLYKP